MNMTRLFGAAIVASLVTLGLLLVMLSLIDVDRSAPLDEETVAVADIFMPERQIETEYDTTKPERPEDPEQPPPEMPDMQFEAPAVQQSAVSISAPEFETGFDIKGVGGFGSDGEYLPIVKVQPTYPRRALNRGLEGYVVVEFTVTTTGGVRDPHVLESMAGRNGQLSPSTVFNRAAVQAVMKFKYKPRILDGEPVEVPGVRNKIRFAIAK